MVQPIIGDAYKTEIAKVCSLKPSNLLKHLTGFTCGRFLTLLICKGCIIASALSIGHSSRRAVTML